MKRRTQEGFTLVELLTTIAVIGVLTAAGIPSFRGLQARQNLRLAQKSVQSSLYRLQNLAIAPQEQQSGSVTDVVGYGLWIVHSNPSLTTLTMSDGCRVTSIDGRDFIALIKYVRNRQTGQITPQLNAVKEPTDCSSASSAGLLSLRSNQDDYFVFPSGVKIHEGSSVPAFGVSTGWLIPRSLRSAEQAFNTSLLAPSTQGNSISTVLPFSQAPDASPKLVLEQTNVKIDGKPLCHSIAFTDNSNGVAISAVKESCS
jgi:prepilin-type N-terminal cleavage/methylation domain-containing protein